MRYAPFAGKASPGSVPRADARKRRFPAGAPSRDVFFKKPRPPVIPRAGRSGYAEGSARK